MSANFNSILTNLGKPEEAERPKPFPVGSYNSVVKGHEFGESSKKKTPFVKFQIRHVAPLDDVDQAELAEVKNWQQREMGLTFYLTEDAIYRLREFADHCGVNYTGRTWAEVIPEFNGTTFTSVVEHQMNEEKPNEPPFAQIGQTAAA